MQKRKFLTKLTAMCLVLLLGAGCVFPGAGASVIKTYAKNKAASSGNSLKKAEEEKKALEKELKEAQQTIQDLKGTKGNIESKVAELNQQLMNISARITGLENQLAEKSDEIVQAKEDLEKSRRIEEKQYEDMKVRIQYMYENGQSNYLDALLSTQNISDFLNAAEYIAQIQEYDRQKLQEYQETVEAVTNMEAQLEADYQELAELKASVEQEKISVAGLMKEKETELAGISDQITNAQDEADAYAAEIQAQEEMIAEIKRLEAEKAAAGVVNHPYTGGAFKWPCPSSTRVTSEYGERVSPTSGASSYHRGIDIGASYGADIIAAADGTVTTASYSSSAGNYVMIDHGGGLYTVYMHASSLIVSAGQTVTAGQVVAKVGSTGISTGNHLHFGVSLNGSYVSPWGYLGG